MRSQKIAYLQVFLLGIVVILFWGLRVTYWDMTKEIIFSDMADYDRVAHNIATSFNYDWNNFWRTYTTPTLVTTRAIQILLFGDSIFAWQLFQSVLVFVSLLWLSYELKQVTSSSWMSLALLFTISISKSSVFWSLKLSRESLHEAFIYALIAGFIYAYQKKTRSSFFILGLVSAANFLNRGNAFFILPFLFLMILYMYLRDGDQKIYWRLIVPSLGIYFLGIAVLWVPWVSRSMSIYGEPVLLSTQAPYASLWEIGTIIVQLEDGSRIQTHVNELQKNAQSDFPTDLAASKYADSIWDAWFREHWKEFPRLAINRIHNTVLDRQIDLTKVDRNYLFSNKVVNTFLVDKTVFLVYSGSVGTFMFFLVFRKASLLSIPVIVLVPWLSGGMWISDGRMLEPALPMILFSNIVWLILLYLCLRWTFSRVSSLF